MKVSVSHREVSGLFGSKRYFADFTVAFNEEEGAVIRHRNLAKKTILVAGEIKPKSDSVVFFGLLVLAPGGFFGLIIGFIVLAFTSYGWLLIVPAVICLLISYKLTRDESRGMFRRITLKHLLQSGEITVFADSPTSLALEVNRVEEGLAEIKFLLTHSVELPISRKYEL